MRNKGKKGQVNDKYSIQSRIEQKRAALRDLQGQFSQDSEKLQTCTSSEERLRQFIKEINAECSRLETELEHAHNGEYILHDDPEGGFANQQAANRNKIISVLRARQQVCQDVESVSEQLELLERDIEWKVQNYKQMIQAKERQLLEERSELERLEEEEEKLLRRAVRDADGLGGVEVFESFGEEQTIDERRELAREEEELVKKIKMLEEVQNQLTTQISDLMSAASKQ